ncbi:MAG: UvrB/UvrC motif-containing protein, partial [Nitrososphaeraceae archaeon]|nr:UvrB/UvrC motif-containing protein [Nitrososphaeraceae archaeon]
MKNTEDLQGFLLRMNKEMREASDSQNYELAKNIRDTIRIIEKLRIKQKIDLTSNKNEEYIGFKVDITSQKGHVLIFKRINGVICDRQKFEFELLGDNTFSTFLLQYYSSVMIPNTIYVNEDPESKKNLEDIFEKLSNHPVKIKKISKFSNDHKNSNLMELILKNLALHIERKYNLNLISLKEAINLKELPYIIDCFDISNLGNSFAVGSCVRFIDGIPFTNGYRRFRIKTIKNKQDDFAMINEIVRRRYITKNCNRKLNSKLETYFSNISKDAKEKFIGSHPNLIVIDGGKGQLNAALRALSEVDLEIAAISLAKENEEIFLPYLDRSLKLSRRNPGLKLLQSIRDEAHRFAVTYNRTLRKNRYSETIFSKEN